jgi:hypothetical protein
MRRLLIRKTICSIDLLLSRLDGRIVARLTFYFGVVLKVELSYKEMILHSIVKGQEPR